MTANEYRYAQYNTRKGILSRAERSRLVLFLKLDLEGASLGTIREVLTRTERDRKARQQRRTY